MGQALLDWVEAEKARRSKSTAPLQIPNTPFVPPGPGPAIPEPPKVKSQAGKAEETPPVQPMQGVGEAEAQRESIGNDHGARDELQKRMATFGQNELAYYNQDLAKGTADKNINEKTARETLKWQRLVDKLNNQVYRMPGTMLGGDVHTGGGGYQPGSAMMKYPQVETEETRQMNAIRERAALRDKQELARQDRYKNLDITNEEAMVLENIRRSAAITDDMRERYNTIWLEGILRKRRANDIKFKAEEDAMRMNLEMAGKTAIANVIIPLMAKSPFAASLLADLYDTMTPDIWQMITMRIQGELVALDQAGASTADVVKRISAMVQSLVGAVTDEAKAVITKYTGGGAGATN